MESGILMKSFLSFIATIGVIICSFTIGALCTIVVNIAIEYTFYVIITVLFIVMWYGIHWDIWKDKKNEVTQ